MLNKGRIGEIFACGANRVVKLFYSGIPMSVVEHELSMSQIMNRTNLPVAKVYDLVNVDDRLGIVYDRIDGSTLLHLLLNKPWKIRWIANVSAELHVRIHHCISDELPSQRAIYENYIRESADIDPYLKSKALQLLESLPDKNHICHGDFHPDNIIVSSNGPVILDWANASRGNSIADFVLSSLILQVATIPKDMKRARLFNMSKTFMLNSYTRKYKQLKPLSKAEINGWIVPVAITRLRDNIESEREKLMQIISDQLMHN